MIDIFKIVDEASKIIEENGVTVYKETCPIDFIRPSYFISTVDVGGGSKGTVTVLRQNGYSGKAFPGIIVYSTCDADLCVQIERAHA